MLCVTSWKEWQWNDKISTNLNLNLISLSSTKVNDQPANGKYSLLRMVAPYALNSAQRGVENGRKCRAKLRQPLHHSQKVGGGGGGGREGR